MNNLDNHIKLKLQTLVENKINEDVASTLEQLIAKYGQKFVNLFGDDVVRAAEVNLGDDAVKLLGQSVDDATQIIIKNGEKAFITQSGKRDVPLRWIIDDLNVINRDPTKYETVVKRYGDLRLKNGTLVKDFFKKTKSKPKPKVDVLKQKWAKFKNNEFVSGFNTQNAIVKWMKNIPKWGKDLKRLTLAERGQIVVWFNSGVPNVREIARIFRTTGWDKDLVMKSLLNVSGQVVGRWWWWTWRIAAYNFVKQLAIDWYSDKIIYKDFLSAAFTRFVEAWSWSGLHYLIPAKVAWDNIVPYIVVLVKGGGMNAVVNKGELVKELEIAIDTFKKSLQKIENYSKSAESRKLLKDKVLNKIDSAVTAADTTNILNFKPNQSSSDSTTRQRTDNTVKPKFVDPFDN